MKPLPPLADQAPRPECIAVPGELPKLDPRPMPSLPRAWRYRMSLWRLFDKPGD